MNLKTILPFIIPLAIAISMATLNSGTRISQIGWVVTVIILILWLVYWLRQRSKI